MSIVIAVAEAPPGDAVPISYLQGSAYATASRVISNLRAAFIFIVVAFHASLAYLSSTPRPTAGFGDPPFPWLAIPIIDQHRWIGFDLYGAWVDVHAMSVMFFVSGLFVAPSLARKGAPKFIYDRVMRLGLPFVFSIFLLMPIAIYPVYLAFGGAPELGLYVSAFLALPFFPNGPTWFCWLLLAFSIATAIVYAVWPNMLARLGSLASGARLSLGRYFIGLTLAAAVAYVPLALLLDPWGWHEHGLFTFQYSRPLLYGVYFAAGVGVGAFGLERGLLTSDGALKAAWPKLTVLAPLALFMWMGLTDVTLTYPEFAPAPMRFVSALSYVLAGTSGVFFVMSTAVRYGMERSRLLDVVSRNALGLFVLHYPFIVWMQYALRAAPLHALFKALVVFLATIVFSLASTEAIRRTGIGARLIGEHPLARLQIG